MKALHHHRRTLALLFAGLAVLAALEAFLLLRPDAEEALIDALLRARRQGGQPSALQFLYPAEGTLFPPEIVPPTISWEDKQSASDSWLVSVTFAGAGDPLNSLASASRWTPSVPQWEAIKKQSLDKEARITVLGYKRLAPQQVLSEGHVTISTSMDPVGAPIFYREVILPFIEAVKDPSRLRWRFGPISSPGQPPVVLENLPVCANCHSFTRDASTLAMDVDYANSKGSYVIARVAQEMVLATSDIITWNDYRKEDNEQTFGLLSQISPDGRFVISTVKDKSVFVPMPDLSFSQLFFPIKGILVVYDRVLRTFSPLSGADDPALVQSNPSWSPDGRFILFARSKAYELQNTQGRGKVLLTPDECREFVKEGKPFLFDLYRIPFNGGKGGVAEPIPGASNNGMSNYFPRCSPDGKWIVFCKAKSYMLLQPDSALHVIPSEGGEARRLECNTQRMNSWHSFSPNGKWMVFSSKSSSPYTQLFLTHFTAEGKSSPPVLLDQFTAPDRAANIPEFVCASPADIKRIREQFLDDYSYLRAGNAFYRHGGADDAIRNYREAIALNPKNCEAHQKLGFLLCNVKKLATEGIEHTSKALEIDPTNPFAQFDMGVALMRKKDYQSAERHLSQAVRTLPDGFDKQYDAVEMRHSLAMALMHLERFQESAEVLREALRRSPENPRVHYYLALALAKQGVLEDAVAHYEEAVRRAPSIDLSPHLHDSLGINYASAGRLQEAIASATKALSLAHTGGLKDLEEQIRQRLELYKQGVPYKGPVRHTPSQAR